AISSSPWVFRLFQITVNGLAAVVLFLCFNHIFRRQFSGRMATWTAFVGALIFAIHPGISEAVLWISTIADPLATLLYLSSFAYLLSSPPRVRLSSFLFLLALLTKETSLMFFPIILLYLVLFDKKTLRPVLIWFLGTSLFYGLIRVLAVGTSAVQGLRFPSPIAQATMIVRLLTVPAEVLYYLKTFFFPMPLAISRHFVVSGITDRAFLLPAALLATLLLVVFRMRRNKLFLFFIAWFFVMLLPALNVIIPLSATVADRWFYAAAIGAIGAVLTVIVPLASRIKPAAIFLAVLLFGLLSAGTVTRSLQWKNGVTLYTHDVAVNSSSFDLQNNYGVELFRHGQIEEASQAFARSIALNPRWWVAANNLGAVYERQGNASKAKEQYQMSIKAGDYYLAYENLAKLLVFRLHDPKQAMELAQRAVRAFPASTNLWMVFAIAAHQTGNKEEALAAAKQLYLLSPIPRYAELYQRIASNQPLDFSQ
ncbi:tetratricopeptide repeat protein, partial [Candidatus Gottesmanbacteria bacterium]|nr:tetratricopeptide repeat protein [Candidatus Gottesmanbacteria bacterium]